jgi:hypothetical protein
MNSTFFSATRHGQARAEGVAAASGAIAVETEDVAWSYAVSFNLSPLSPGGGSGKPRVVVDVEVEFGRLGIGCMTADHSSFVDREQFVSAGVRRKVYVPVGEPGAAASLMLRNGDTNGRSIARIYGIEIRQVSPVEEIEERLRHTGPVEPPVTHGLSVVQAFGPIVASPAFQPIRVETGELDGSYAASFGLTWPLDLTGIGMPRVVVDVEVESGRLGIGCMTADHSSFVDREQFVSAGMRRKVYVPVGEPGAAASLMLRNGSPSGRSVARIHEIQFRRIDPRKENWENLQHTLWDASVALPQQFPCEWDIDKERCLELLASFRSALGQSLTQISFQIAVTHTSRQWSWEHCSKVFLWNRYHRIGRLDALPAFEDLPSALEARSYSGRLTLFDLTFTADEISLTATRCIDSQDKIQHAGVANGKLVICMENYLLVLANSNARLGGDAEPGQIERIDDPWFSGLHTVFAADESHCVVSASAPDAVLLLDIKRRQIVRRWRLPPEPYGRNYDLTDQMSVHAHHIYNDIQLGHLNCAFPDGQGGFWISTLGQGDIGHVKTNGDYELIASGFVGCHGIRYSDELGCLYFSDSCTGRLIAIGSDRRPQVIGRVNSRWLHDAQHLAANIFVLCLGDENAIVLLDTASGTEIARFSMKERGENVQFLSLTGALACT